MSSVSRFNQQPGGSKFIRLPSNFLGLDFERTAAAANQQRSMQDLERGRGLMDRVPVLSDAVAEAYESNWEDNTSSRHLMRGAALARLLIEDGVSGFSVDLAGFQHSQLDDESEERSSRIKYDDALGSLRQARYRASLAVEARRIAAEEAAQNRRDFDLEVDAILETAGFEDSFDIALAGLTGEGLEEPTIPTDARYGAAVVALAIGIING